MSGDGESFVALLPDQQADDIIAHAEQIGLPADTRALADDALEREEPKRLRELVATGEAGEVAPRHASIMGSLTAPGRLVKRTAPAIAEMLRGDGVDAAALVPV